MSDFTSFAVGIHAFALLSIPLHEPHNRVVDLDELLGADAELWAEQLSGTPDWLARFTALDNLLADRMRAGPEPCPELASAWRQMQRAGGAIRIADVAMRLDAAIAT